MIASEASTTLCIVIFMIAAGNNKGMYSVEWFQWETIIRPKITKPNCICYNKADRFLPLVIISPTLFEIKLLIFPVITRPTTDNFFTL